MLLFKLLNIFFSFLVYFLTHSEYRFGLLKAAFELSDGFIEDIVGEKFPYPEGYNWTLRE